MLTLNWGDHYTFDLDYAGVRFLHRHKFIVRRPIATYI